MSLSTTALLYLGADGVAPKDKKLSLGLAVPCRDVSVDLKTLSGVLVASALWSLRESGAAQVGIEAKKGLFGSKSRVAVRPGSGHPSSDLEKALLASLDQKDPYARGLVYRWLGTESMSPWRMAVAPVEAELVQAGMLTPEDPKGLGGRLGALAKGGVTMTGNAAAIAGVQGEVNAAVARWQAFTANEPELAQALVKECRDGIDNRMDTD
jgi:hypothetical protein